MKIKYKAKRSCIVCNGSGHFTNAFDQIYRCDCYKETKKYKMQKKKNNNGSCSYCYRKAVASAMRRAKKNFVIKKACKYHIDEITNWLRKVAE